MKACYQNQIASLQGTLDMFILQKIGVQNRFGVTGPEFTEISQSKIYERVAAPNKTLSRNLTGGQEPERIAAAAGHITMRVKSLLTRT